jgi:HEAT repeat protein
VRLLEWGDADLVAFAQEVLSAHPDPAAVAAALGEAAERGLARNFLFLNNVLGAVGNGEVGRALEPLLRRCMEAEDPVTRERAIRAWSRSVAEPDPAVLAARAAVPWARTAFAAMAELELHRGPAAAEALRAVFPRVSPFARAGACNYLGRLGDPASIPLLESELEAADAPGGPGAPLRIGALQGLARLGSDRGIEGLRRWVEALPLEATSVDLEADRTRWDGPEAILASRKDAGLRTRLLRQARHGPAEAAAAAVALLAAAYLPDAEAVTAFREVLERPDADAILLAESLDGLGRAGAADAKAKALALLGAPAPERRYAAALALARWKDPSTGAALSARLPVEPDPGAGRKICDALGILGDPAAAPALVAYLASDPAPDPAGALQAWEASANLRGPLAVAAAPDLARLAREGRTPAVRFHAARALGRAAGAPEARPALEGLLRDGDPSIRTAAADGLGALGDAGARGALAQAYARETVETAQVAIRNAILRLDLGRPRAAPGRATIGE